MDSPTQLAPRVLRVEEAAQLLGIGRSLVYDLIREGRLRSFKVGSRRLIPVTAVNDFIDSPEGVRGADSV